MSHPAGTICVVSGTLARYPNFSRCLLGLEKPAGTQLNWSVGAGIAQNRNDGIRKRAGSWVLLLDDDHEFAPDLLIRLLNTKKDVVVPLVVRREPPHATVVYDGYIRQEEVAEGQPWGYTTHHLKAGEEPGLFQVVAAGTGGMLLRENVIKAVGDPWFEVGKFKSEELSEDLWFAKKVEAKGFEMWCDSRVTMSHLTPVGVWPVYRDGKWWSGYQFGAEARMPLVRAAGEEGE